MAIKTLQQKIVLKKDLLFFAGLKKVKKRGGGD
jgi:hypothetical protein